MIADEAIRAEKVEMGYDVAKRCFASVHIDSQCDYLEVEFRFEESIPNDGFIRFLGAIKEAGGETGSLCVKRNENGKHHTISAQFFDTFNDEK